MPGFFLSVERRKTMLSLTKNELLERLLEPQRSRLLSLAINEDIHSVFPLSYEARKQEEIDIDITEHIQKIVFKSLFRVTDLAFDENLDRQHFMQCER
jgi:hypothetical protein